MLHIKRFIRVLGTLKSLYYNVFKDAFAECGTNVILEAPMKVSRPQNIHLGNNVAIRGFFTFVSHTGHLYIRDNVGISQFLTVVTGNHTTKPPVGKWQVDCNHTAYGDIEKDIIIEEDVWIGIRVTIMPGVIIGRGSIIGAGSVVVKNIPPYSIAAGVPCRVIKRKYTFEEVIERENAMYDESNRIPIEYLRTIYQIENI